MSSEFICDDAHLAIQNVFPSKCQIEALPHTLVIEFMVQILGLGLAGTGFVSTDWKWFWSRTKSAYLGSGPNEPMSCRTQEWIYPSINTSVQPYSLTSQTLVWHLRSWISPLRLEISSQRLISCKIVDSLISACVCEEEVVKGAPPLKRLMIYAFIRANGFCMKSIEHPSLQLF